VDSGGESGGACRFTAQPRHRACQHGSNTGSAKSSLQQGHRSSSSIADTPVPRRRRSGPPAGPSPILTSSGSTVASAGPPRRTASRRTTWQPTFVILSPIAEGSTPRARRSYVRAGNLRGLLHGHGSEGGATRDFVRAMISARSADPITASSSILPAAWINGSRVRIGETRAEQEQRLESSCSIIQIDSGSEITRARSFPFPQPRSLRVTRDDPRPIDRAPSIPSPAIHRVW